VKSRTAKRRQEAEADARGRTADLFAAADASPTAPAVLAPIPPIPSILPAPHTAGHRRSKQLWYAAVFPRLAETGPPGLMLQRLCLYAQQFTSFVSIEAPDALLLEIKGSLQLLGPLETLHADIDACWRRLALSAHSATAPSTLAALWLARSGGQPGSSAAAPPIQIEDLGALAGRLAELPIACTAWENEWLQTLHAMGVTRVGEVLRLPRAGLARRLGPAAVQDLDIALARQFAPRRAFVPRERFRARCDFESEIETVAYLEKALGPLIARCAQFLRKRQAGVQRLRLRLRHRTGPATDVHLGLASITGERRRLTDVLTQKLARLELSAPVRSLELMSGSLLPLSAGSLDVFAALGSGGAGTGAGCGRDSVPQLVERLRARLGEDAVYGVVSIPEHRPEAAWRRVHELPEASVRRVGEKMPNRDADDGMPRPVWLLDAPLALSESDMHEFHQSGLVLEQGPERIESGWWDGRGVARDYYVARRMAGARRSHGAKLWVFQERQSKRWYLHGMFA
jgi:protein ImuB